MNTRVTCKLGIQQRVLPAYRAPFFDRLAQACDCGLAVFAGLPRPSETLGPEGELNIAKRYHAQNLNLGEGRLFAFYQRGMIEWLEDWNPDALVVEANPRNLSVPSALRWMRAHSKPVVGWGLGAPPGRGFWRSLLRERFVSRFDAIITYSRLGAEQYAAAGIAPERIFIAPNAVAPRPSAPPPERGLSWRDGRAEILFVGRLQARKRVDVLLQACAALPEALQPRLTIVGDGPERAAIQAQAAQIYPRAVFAGAVHGEDLAPYWQAADLFVLPGTGGLAIQQAMATGLPVLAAEADGTQSDLVRAGNGRLIPPGNVQELTQTLAEVLADPAALRAMGRESFRIVSEEINLEAMVDAFWTALRSVLQ